MAVTITTPTFTNRVVQYPGRYVLNNVSGNTYDLVRSEGTVTVAGTPQNEATFNKIKTDLDALNTNIGKIETNGIIGDNEFGAILVTNLNTITKCGFYQCSTSATGVPPSVPTNTKWLVLHENNTTSETDYKYQRAVAMAPSISPISYERTNVAGWNDWKLIPNDADITDLKNVTKFITATAGSNGDFKININNVLETGLTVYVTFPVATVLTANSRFSIDNGTTYKNVFIDNIQSIAKSIIFKSLMLRYDGTQWQVIELLSYSTSEIKTNEIWTNGKPIYKKTFVGNMPSGGVDATVNIFSLGGLNIDEKWIDYGNSFYKATTSPYEQLLLNWYYSSTDWCRTNCTNDYVRIRYGSVVNSTLFTYVIIVKYTKTTD